jgi:hypothetical protein
MEYLRALSDPTQKRREEMLEWLGDFDPEEFSLESLSHEFYCE